MRQLELQKGFTLIEVMLSAVLLGLLVAFYSGIIVQSLEVREKITGAVRHYEMYQGYLERLEKDLRGAYVEHQAAGEREQKTLIFLENNTGSGQDLDTLILTTMTNFQFDQSGERVAFDHAEIEYQFDDEPYRNEDSVAWDLYRRSDGTMDGEPTEGGYSFLFVKKIRGFNVRFFSRRTKSWEESWDTRQNGNEFPAAAEVVLWVGQGDDPEGWRPLVKTMFLELEVDGKFQAESGCKPLDRECLEKQEEAQKAEDEDESQGEGGSEDPEQNQDGEEDD